MVITEVAAKAEVPKEELGEEHVFLVGRPPLEEYLGFMSTEPIGSESANQRLLAEEWRSANDHVKELQRTEPTWADNPSVQPIAKELEPLVAEVKSDPFLQKAYLTPLEFGVLDLDRVVVFQKIINLAFVRKLQKEVGPNPSQEDIFHFCLPFTHPTVNHRVRRIANNAFSFVSVSNDIRFLEAVVLRPDQIQGHQAAGPLAGVVGLFVGYGPNYLSVISAEGRQVLSNGSHRAFALREMGISKVPCLIQKVTRREELNVIIQGPLSQTPDIYLKDPRPPVLKDYFDPALQKLVRLQPKARQVRIAFGVEPTDIPLTAAL